MIYEYIDSEASLLFCLLLISLLSGTKCWNGNSTDLCVNLYWHSAFLTLVLCVTHFSPLPFKGKAHSFITLITNILARLFWIFGILVWAWQNCSLTKAAHLEKCISPAPAGNCSTRAIFVRNIVYSLWGGWPNYFNGTLRSIHAQNKRMWPYNIEQMGYLETHWKK